MPADAPGGRPGLLQRLRRTLSRLPARLVAFNLALVLVPLGGAFFVGLHELLGRYERQLLEAQERSMAQQGRLLAAALAESGAADPEGSLAAGSAEQILAGLEQRITARLRVWDRDGRVLADSSRLGPRRDQLAAPIGGGAGEDGAGADAGPGESWLYRLGAAPFRLWHRLTRPEPPPGGAAAGPEEAASGSPSPDAPAEVRAALEGRYGASVRPTPGDQRSVTLHVAIPVRLGDRVLGAAQASQSTFRILQDLRSARLAFFQVFLASIAVAVILSLALAATISRPVRRLRAEAATLVDRRGRLRGTFSGSDHLDEIGDLARALEGLSRRVEEHVQFVEAFAADVSHEFKNPLTSIRAATEMLSEARDREERRRLLAIVEGEVARMERLLTAVREMSLIDSRLDEEETGDQDLGRLLEALVEGVSLRAPEGVGVELHLPEEERLAVRGSADRLVQVFENLLDNALGFAPVGSTVRIDLARERTEALVTVRDDGPGLPPEHLDRVFDRFFTYRPGASADGGPETRHSGLGLAIVKAVVEGYGGSVQAANRESGGARFEVRLPLVKPSETPERP